VLVTAEGGWTWAASTDLTGIHSRGCVDLGVTPSHVEEAMRGEILDARDGGARVHFGYEMDLSERGGWGR
jgi:hypothetical protein